MELGIKDRIALQRILPKEGNMVTLRLVRELRENLEFTPEEIKQLKIEFSALGVKWDPEQSDYVADIDINEHNEPIIKQALRELDRQNKLPAMAMDLWDLFVK